LAKSSTRFNNTKSITLPVLDFDLSLVVFDIYIKMSSGYSILLKKSAFAGTEAPAIHLSF